MRDFTFEIKNKEIIGIKNDILKLQKIIGTYKNYGCSFYNSCSEVLINYT